MTRDDSHPCVFYEKQNAERGFSPVNCYPGDRNCSSCGWNPVVHEQRVKKLRKERAQKK